MGLNDSREAPDPREVLRAEGATFRVGSGAGSRALVEGADLALRAGRMTALLGPNGAGKSTLMKMLAGALRPSAGAILLHGKPLERYGALESARMRAVLPQESSLPFAFTVEEVALMGRYPHVRGAETARDREIARACLAFADLLPLKDRLYPTLSGGERQRTHWARVLAQLDAGAGLEGKCLLLDEPTSSLDLAHQHALLSGARALAQRGAAVLVILHDLNLAAQYADELVLLRGGVVAVRGAPATVLTRERILDVYGVESLVIGHPETGAPWVMTGPNSKSGKTDEPEFFRSFSTSQTTAA